MRLIGLCGRSGSGKGLFSKIASQNGLDVIDCDAVYKQLVSKPSPCLLEIADSFGSFVVKDNALDRRALAPIVFSDKEKLDLLNKITHKHIRSEIENILASFKEESLVIIDAPTLFESGIHDMCDLIVAVLASDEICAERIISRDNIPREEALNRLKNQKDNAFLIENCDCIVYNEQTPEMFANDVLHVITLIREGKI